MALPSVDWLAIRAHHGSQHTGFEELCVQLAHFERPPESGFIRKGTPDAGVEGYAVLPGGAEWGWQAKYFVKELGSSQWAQLDESVKSAIEKHPRLVRYIACIPLDLADPRISQRRSAKEHWDEHVDKWRNWASIRGMAVEFVYWGNHELLNFLNEPRHVGRLRYWFDIHRFGDNWFKARLEEAQKAAGARYTPEIHVGLPIADEFEAFGRTTHLYDRLAIRARELNDKLRSFEYTIRSSTPEVPDISSSSALIAKRVRQVISALLELVPEPARELSFSQIADQAREAAETETLAHILLERERDHEKNRTSPESGGGRLEYGTNPFQNQFARLTHLQSELRSIAEALTHAHSLASSNLLLLCGDAGTGKTHLLCDIAKKRLEEGRPTILLMGQLFLSTDAPWSQARQQLDLTDLSVEEFVGAMEAAAQASGCRALVMIDALNEGAGRSIWPDHLPPFLAHLERSPWIAVVLSVRSSYEHAVVREDLRQRAARLVHSGFAGCEYEAAREFFSYYHLDFPSTPIHSPEFRNPLYLKTLCVGLNKSGLRKIPRGFHGVSSTFDLYLDAINGWLSEPERFDFNPKLRLVRLALEGLAKAFVETGDRWLPLSRAMGIVDGFLPGRHFSRSLYQGLVSEGILAEEGALFRAGATEEVVRIGYERLADYLVAQHLLGRHLNKLEPETVFAPGAPLGFLNDSDRYVPSGLIEALCVQLPELIGRELPELAPGIIERWEFADAFRQSIVWRATTAFSNATRDYLNGLPRSEDEFGKTLDALLTVATLPGHPFNALFLDRRLRNDAMPDRDAWWSTYLHRRWETRGPVDRLVAWAWSLQPDDNPDDETVDLCAITLAWMLTTSNRFLRDRATKALVNLLTGRLKSAERLVERFWDIDDLYVLERVYAVAYGASMRSNDPLAVGPLAQRVYDHAFSSGSPAAHILLRDYARGVVECALHLGAKIEIGADLIRPPYRSIWPHIPTDEEIKPLMPDFSDGSATKRDNEIARAHITGSVLHDDFARYVIGTNTASTNWLSLRLDEPSWMSQEERLQALIAEFSDEEKAAWSAFSDSDDAVNASCYHNYMTLVLQHHESTKNDSGVHSPEEHPVDDDESNQLLNPSALEQDRIAALTALDAVLTAEHLHTLNDILGPNRRKDSRSRPPRFDLRLIQRYILWRVFDLGWTPEHFGDFDRFEVDDHGRAAKKAERIGKKYQWIAYHEIMAFVADHYQYREEFREVDGDRVYEGTWQDYFRDIDPSSALRTAGEEIAPTAGLRTSWLSVNFDKWDTHIDYTSWAKRHDDLPQIESFLSTCLPGDGAPWANLQSFVIWEQPTPPGSVLSDVGHRELWCSCSGYLIRAEDVDAFQRWAESVNFIGRGMPEPPEVDRMFLGEHGWSPASRYYQRMHVRDNSAIQLGKYCPINLQIVALKYAQDASSFDSSIDKRFTLRLPSVDLIHGLGLRQSGGEADFVDAAGERQAFDPSAHGSSPSALLVRQVALKEFLEREELALCWAVNGEKRLLGGPETPERQHFLCISGAYVLGDKGPVGFTKFLLGGETQGDDLRLLHIRRST
jgi:hypothetical protein